MKSKVGVADCVKIRSIAVQEGFFRVPIIVNTDETSKMLFGQRVDEWLSRINHKHLTPSHRAEKKSTLHVCGSHFTSGRPASLQDEKHKGNKILYDLMNQNEIINSVTANNNDSKETQIIFRY